jgi:hypothetical protein
LLSASYTPFFAAGLGEITGRGRVVGTDGHGLAIVDLNEPLPYGLPLRVGGPDVSHGLQHRGRRHDLSMRAAHRLVRLQVARRPRLGAWRCDALD